MLGLRATDNCLSQKEFHLILKRERERERRTLFYNKFINSSILLDAYIA